MGQHPFGRLLRAGTMALVAVWVRVWSELRARWRPALSLALLVALAAGATLAAVAGARRTHTAYTRFVAAQHSWDFAVMVDQDSSVAPTAVAEIERLPGVAESHRGILLYTDAGGVGVPFLAPADGAVGATFHRYELLEGRRPDPAKVDEAVVGFAAADRYGLEVGDTVSAFDFRLEPFRIVGIEAAPGEFPPLTVGLIPQGYLTPAAHRYLLANKTDEEGAPPKESLLVRLDPGADVESFRREVGRRNDGLA
ncbi:MAG: ABC transporter permease, partial [Actinomycetota bacterium]|nr:ABC transporter permease [Actinomycetota bacterium]